jgi:hypothetical protein
MWKIGWAPNNIPIYMQRDAMLHSLFISVNCSTRFRWYFHPSSGAHTTVFTASVICHTVTAICHYRGRVGTGSNSSTIAADTSDGVTNTRCCRYSCMRSWWWVEVPPETFREVSRFNKLCNVASRWIYIGILLGAHPILYISRIRVKTGQYSWEKNFCALHCCKKIIFITNACVY